MVTTQVPDPFDAANEAKPRETGNKHYFGSLLVDAYNAVLVKGEGKVVFDPARHSPDQRVTALEIVLTSLPRTGGQEYQIKRELIAESNEWAKIVKPSLDKLAVNLKALQNRYVQAEMIPHRTYVNKSGETKQATTFRFLAVYDSQQACQAACDAFYSARNGGAGAIGNSNGQQATPPAAPNPTPSSNGGSNAERMMAVKFLPALYKTAAEAAKAEGKPDEAVAYFGAEIAKNKLTAKYFTLDSQEVIDVVMTQAAPF